jgi:uncharacterized protein (TIGR00269 family)
MNVEQKVKRTIEKYKLASKRDKILIALSGGKDSATTAYLLHKLGFQIEGFHINLGMGGYSERCLNAVKELSAQLGIKLHVYDIKKEMGNSMCYLRSAIQSKKSLKNCAICGVIKKWIMNKEARKLKVDKIATGHNLDDEAQTFLVNMFKGAPELSVNTGPISRNISDKKFIPRIKPLFFVAEEQVREFSKKMKLPVVYEHCPCAIDSYRIQVREFMKTLTDKQKENIMKNAEKVIKRLEGKRNSRVNYCEVCGEPSRNKICKTCELMKLK